MQLVKHVERVHSNFITGLEFVPCHTTTGQSITGDSEAAVISISVDNQVFFSSSRQFLFNFFLFAQFIHCYSIIIIIVDSCASCA